MPAMAVSIEWLQDLRVPAHNRVPGQHSNHPQMWRERWSIRWRDKIVERHDTIYCDQETETVRVERVVPAYYKGVSWAFWILVVLLVAATAIRILIRVYLKK